VIRCKNIHKRYGSLEVLKGIDLEVQKAEIVSIVGASGAGKTTLLQIIGSLDKPDNGRIYYQEEEISALSARKLAHFRNKNIGFIFQFHHLLPEFTAVENVSIPAYIGGTSKKDATLRANELLDFLGLSGRANHKPSELSGGEQQRVAVARALMNRPMVILADEPSGNLDTENAKDLHDLFFSLRDEFEQTFVMVTHNQELASAADRKITMKDGLLL
jgi:lipoprotein-releasing system ATP-binding protein